MKESNIIVKLAFVLAACFTVSCTSDEIPYSYSDDGNSDPSMRTVRLSEAGTLSQKISENEKYSIEKIKIIGEINGSDIKLLRDMAGNNFRGDKTEGKLKVMDLSNARIVTGGERYLDADTLRYDYYDYYVGNWRTDGRWSSQGGYRFVVDSINQIPRYAFFGCKLQSVTLPKAAVAVQNYAFCYCTSLNSCEMQNGLKRIEYSAYSYCYNLKSIRIPTSVSSITNTTFDYCVNLDYISVDSDNPYYDSRDNCYALIHTKTNRLVKGCKSTKIPDGITTIGYDAFGGCEQLKSIVIPNSVTAIEGYAFCRTGLTTINIPESVTTIGYSAFSNSDVKSISIPNSITEISEDLFYNCKSLTTVSIPQTVKEIGSYAFGNCEKLTSIEIPSAVDSIFKYTFSGCSSLTSVSIPSSVKYIGKSAFSRCEKLSSVSIPYNLENIEPYSFQYCKSLKNISIPSSVKTIGRSAFYGCSGATSIYFPSNSSLTDIGEYAFYDCDGITSIDIYAKKVGEYAFAACDNLKRVYLRSSIQSIGENAFYQKYNSSGDYINYVKSEITSMFSINENVFRSDVYDKASLYVPSGYKSSYQSRYAWSKFKNIYTY